MAQDKKSESGLTSQSTTKKRSTRVSIIGYSFSIFALAVFLYVFLFPVDKELKQQAIYWFYTSLVAALVPNIKELKLKDFEVEFKEEIVREIGAKIEEQTEELKQNVVRAVEKAIALEEMLPEDYKMMRDKQYLEHVDGIQDMSSEKRFECRKQHSLEFLRSRNIEVHDFKQMLQKIKCYQGELDNEFDGQLVRSILEFQEQYDVTPAGGIIGPKTFNKIALLVTASGVK